MPEGRREETGVRNEVIGFAMTGSFCTFEGAFQGLEELRIRFANIVPIMSEISARANTRFGLAKDHMARLETLCGRKVLTGIEQVEPIGPKGLLDLLVIAPCTGNTLSKMALGITDSTVSMAAKAQLRNDRPVLLGISTNDGLSGSGKNIMELLQKRNIYVVPFGQDDPTGKPASLKSNMQQIADAAEAALEGKQLQPVLI